MQRLNKFILIIIVIIVIIGCKSTSKSNHKKYLNYLHNNEEMLPDDYIEKLKKFSSNVNWDSIRAITSDFYDIEIRSKANKPIFNLEEKKLFSMQITNYGTKELHLPEWFRVNQDFDDVEMKIEIYKKEKQKFEKYIQKRMTTYTHSQPGVNLPKRIVFETKKGKHIPYENIWIDMHKIIVDEGSYKAKVYIDLSNFGYFKTLETEFLFEVKK
jgi:hypothetical protein